MTAWRRTAALALLTAVAVAPAGDASAVERAPGHVLFEFTDDEVFESSGLVDEGRTVYTINDSGDDAVVYAIDAASGDTTSRITYADSVDDVEALAPGPGRTLWAGDIGDNRQRRDDIAVYRVGPEHAKATRYTLRYPDGSHDAETLLVHPASGRVLVVTKSPFGGTVYAAPTPLDERADNRLRVFGHVAGLVTDGAFYADGRHVVLRTYDTASVYTFPGFELRGTVRLPRQPQGEGISVSPTGRVLVSSEGVHAKVLQVTLPRSLLAPAPAPAPSVVAPSTTAPARRPVRPQPDPRGPGAYAVIAIVGAALAYGGWLTVRNSRVQSRR